MNPGSAVDSIASDITKMTIDDDDQRHLLKVPPEIRLRLYSFMFAAKGPILLGVRKNGQIYQPESDRMNDNWENQKVELSAQFLATCSQIYHEGTAFLYSYNSIEMLDVDTHNLGNARLTLSTRAFMTKISFLSRTNERLNLSAIGICFPSLQTINIRTQGSGASLLILAYELAKSLPCSDIRPWPTLELHIQVPTSDEAIKDFTKILNDSEDHWQVNKNPKDTRKIKELMRIKKDTLKLTDFEPYMMPILKLGSEMPEVQTIALHGGLLKDYTCTITQYESSYGDCAFEFVREEPVYKSANKKDEYTKMVYAWRRKDAAIANAVRGKNLQDTAALMRQWVPALSPEFVKAMADAGL